MFVRLCLYISLCTLNKTKHPFWKSKAKEITKPKYLYLQELTASQRVRYLNEGSFVIEKPIMEGEKRKLEDISRTSHK